MTKDEAQRLLYTIETTFPNFHPEDAAAAAEIWHSVMADIPFNRAMLALKTYIRTDTTGFAPSPGKLIQAVNFLSDGPKLSTAEAWGMVLKALQNGIYGCEEEFAKLPVDVQRSVGSSGQLRALALAGEEYIATVAKAQFERTYNAVTARSEKVSMLPPDLRASLEYHPEPKPEVKEIPYQIDKEAFRTGVNGDNVMELLERILGA